MSTETLTFGAPSLRKEDARKSFDKRLAAMKFPLTVQVANHLPFQVSFPEAGRLFLRPSGHDGHVAMTTFNRADEFARFVTDVQVLADLHQAETAVSVTLAAEARSGTQTAPGKPEPTPAPSSKSAPTPAAAKPE